MTQEHYAPLQKEVFYQPGQLAAIDIGVVTDRGKIGIYSGKTFDELALEHPGLVIGTAEEFRAQANEAAKTLPERITEAEYDSAFGALPPLHSCRRDGNHTFLSSEFYSGTVTYIYANVDGEFWRFRDMAALNHEEILAKVVAARECSTGGAA